MTRSPLAGFSQIIWFSNPKGLLFIQFFICETGGRQQDENVELRMQEAAYTHGEVTPSCLVLASVGTKPCVQVIRGKLIN